jgi:hypothetical protein
MAAIILNIGLVLSLDKHNQLNESQKFIIITIIIIIILLGAKRNQISTSRSIFKEFD